MSTSAPWDHVFAKAIRTRNLSMVSWRLVVYGILLIGGFTFMLPALWMFTTAFKTLAESQSFPPVWIPSQIQLSNFVSPFQDLPFGQFYVNTLILTVGSIVGILLSCTPVAFVFARLNFRGRDALFIVVLATMMMPDQTTLIPIYVFFSWLGWINTFLPLVVPRFFATDAFVIFLMRQFFMTIPRDLDDACKIDGGSILTLLTRIIIPLCMPLFGVVIILQFVGFWNAFFWPLVFLQTMDKYTISLGLRLFQFRYFVQMNTLMSMSLLASLPTIGLFFLAQRYFIQGIVLTGVNK